MTDYYSYFGKQLNGHFLRVLQASPVTIIPTLFHLYISFICHRH